MAVVVAALAQLVQRELAGSHPVVALDLLQALLELAHHADAGVGFRIVVLLGRRSCGSGLVLGCADEAGNAGQRRSKLARKLVTESS